MANRIRVKNRKRRLEIKKTTSDGRTKEIMKVSRNLSEKTRFKKINRA